MQQFDLMDGGLLNPMFKRVGLGGTSWAALLRRAFVVALICIVPMAVTGDPKFSSYIRFLVALPILILSERRINWRVSLALKHLFETDLVSDSARSRARHLIDHLRVQRDLKTYEIAGFFLVVLLAIHRLRSDVSLHSILYDAVALPIFQAIFAHWAIRYALWVRFLWQLSRLELQLRPAHPDSCGGLSFLAWTQQCFDWVLFASACILTADHASAFQGMRFESLDSLKALGPLGLNLFVLLMISLAVFLIPLIFFTPQLLMTRGPGVLKHSAFADEYVSRFDRKWVDTKDHENPLGSPDIQSSADLISTFQQAEAMRSTLISRRTMLPFVIAALLPVIPLLASSIPFSTLAELISSILL